MERLGVLCHFWYGDARMEIPKELFRTATLHRSLTDDPINGILSCGFLIKPTDRFSHEELIFPYYGGLLLLSGSGTYSDPSGKRVPLTPGCFVQRMPGKPHTTEVVPDGNWLEFFVCFGKDFYEAMADQHLLSREPVLFHPLTEAMVENCRFLLERFRSTPDFQLFSLLLAAQEFAAALTQSAQNKQILPWENRLSKAAEFLCTPMPEYPSPAQAAAMVEMEYETFRKRFKTAFRCSPAAYQTRHRLNYSKQLLVGTKKTIQDIALACGFADGFAFSKAFRQYYGMSPTQFRKSS